MTSILSIIHIGDLKSTQTWIYFFFHQKALSGECGFMAANLYAKSIFGEDALANVSLEKNPAKPDAPVTGIYIFFRQIDL